MHNNVTIFFPIKLENENGFMDEIKSNLFYIYMLLSEKRLKFALNLVFHFFYKMKLKWESGVTPELYP